MGAEPWVSDEAQMELVARRVLSRALHRPVRVIVIALLTSGVVIAARGSRSPSYEASLHFRLHEGDLTDLKNAPRAPHAIREQIANVALSRNRIEQLMKKHHLSGAYLARDRVAAVDEFREEIRIDVSRNYFIYDRRPSDEPRSAQVVISLSGSDAERTRAVLREIGDAILQEQAVRRSDRLAHAQELLGDQIRRARARARSLQETIGRLGLDAARADALAAIRIQARIAALEAETHGAIEQVLALERRAAQVALSSAAEDEQLGLNFELVDESLVVSVPRLTPLQLASFGGLALAIALLLTVPVLGAFDDRVYVPEDLAARGLPLFGALPRFPGDDAGSYRSRTVVYNS